MSLVFQIVLGLALLGGLVLPFIGNKYWHWSQIVLVICVLLAGAGFLVLASETMRIHHVLRAKLPQLEQDLARLEKQNEEILQGVGEKQGLLDLKHRLQIVARERGRVWRNVQPVGEEDPQNIQVEIPQPKPHGLEKGTIVYAFEAGEPDAANPPEGRQYLGEFRVIEATEEGVTLEPVQLLDERVVLRLADSQGPWSLYETMPVDRHKIFAGLSEEELRKWLPAASVEEYIRQGTPATNDDDQWHRVGYDENGKRLGPEQADQAVKWLYDRQLRDYDYLFSELARQRVVLQATVQAVTEDNAMLEEAIKSAKELSQFREQQKQALASDLKGMRKDKEAIKQLHDQIMAQLDKATKAVQQYLALNSELNQRLTELQLNRLRSAPAAPEADLGLLSP